MSKKITLTANPRTIVGSKVKKLREQKKLPANVFGKNVKSMSLELSAVEFDKVYKEAGETQVVELQVGNDTKPVLIHGIQYHPVSNTLLHVDFHQIDLKEKVKAPVPLEVVGSAPAVDQKVGVLLTLLDEVEVEALQTEIPEKLTVDVGKLAHVGDVIKVGDLSLPQGVTVVSSPDTEVVKIGELVSKEAEALAAEEEAAKSAAAAETAAEAPAAEGQQAPAEEKAPAAPAEKSPEEKKE